MRGGFLSLVAWVAICYAVGIATSFLVSEGRKGWYRTLNRPSFTPPDRVFPLVWNALYLLMGIAVWLIWREPNSMDRTRGLLLFSVQLAFNLVWSIFFFRSHRLLLALVEMVFFWFAILGTTIVFWPTSHAAALLMLPYLAWVAFGLVLNTAFWRSNPLP